MGVAPSPIHRANDANPTCGVGPNSIVREIVSSLLIFVCLLLHKDSRHDYV